MMNCNEAIPLLANESDSVGLVTHLQACADCRALASGYRAVPGLVRAAFDRAPGTQDLVRHVLHALAEEGAFGAAAREGLQQELSPEDEARITEALADSELERA